MGLYKNVDKLKLLEDPVVKEVLYDILHKRRSKYSIADNSGHHSEYKEMIKELEEDYKKKQ